MKNNCIIFILATFFITISFQAATAQSWSITGNSNATSTSKFGTTNNFPVKFYTNNIQRMVMDSLGNVGIGILKPLNIFTVKLSGSTPASSWLTGGNLPAFFALGENQATGFNLATAANAPGYRPVLNTKRSRGTLAAPAAVAVNDYLASFVSSGFDGSTFQNPATIDFYVDGTPSTGNVPGRISFVTGSNAVNRMERLKVGSSGDFNFNDNQFTITQANGNVGIGTAAAGTRLDVVGGTTSTPVIRATNTFAGKEDATGILSYSKAADGWGYGIKATGGYRGGYFIGDGGAFTGGVAGVYGSATGTTGTRYGIYALAAGGTDNWGGYFPTKTYTSELRVGGEQGATGYVASINGKLIATEVRVELLASWPDYVFEKGYKLMPIADLEGKINAGGHLPGIPAAVEVKENGIMLGEMQTKTMEKVEENTLYIIQLNNSIKLLQRQKAEESILLNKKIELLEKKIDALTKNRK